jgi:hypothetical protein
MGRHHRLWHGEHPLRSLDPGSNRATGPGSPRRRSGKVFQPVEGFCLQWLPSSRKLIPHVVVRHLQTVRLGPLGSTAHESASALLSEADLASPSSRFGDQQFLEGQQSPGFVRSPPPALAATSRSSLPPSAAASLVGGTPASRSHPFGDGGAERLYYGFRRLLTARRLGADQARVVWSVS